MSKLTNKKNRTMKTTIKATANQSKRTFTLREKDANGKTLNKYRTFPMSREDFENCEYDTSNDWRHFLKTDEYELIK